jgi:hypothetical protein
MFFKNIHNVFKKHNKKFKKILKKMPILLSNFDEKFSNNIDSIINFIKNFGSLRFYIVSEENNSILIEFFDTRNNNVFFDKFSTNGRNFGDYQNNRAVKLSYASVNQILTGETGEFDLFSSGQNGRNHTVSPPRVTSPPRNNNHTVSPPRVTSSPRDRMLSPPPRARARKNTHSVATHQN